MDPRPSRQSRTVTDSHGRVPLAMAGHTRDARGCFWLSPVVACVCVCVCACVRARVRACVSRGSAVSGRLERGGASAPAQVDGPVGAVGRGGRPLLHVFAPCSRVRIFCVRACVRACVLACVRACVLACVRACLRACVSVWVLRASSRTGALSLSSCIITHVPVHVCLAVCTRCLCLCVLSCMFARSSKRSRSRGPYERGGAPARAQLDGPVGAAGRVAAHSPLLHLVRRVASDAAYCIWCGLLRLMRRVASDAAYCI